MKKLLGLIGYPLSHSFSEKYFKSKFEREGLTSDYDYKNFELSNLSSLNRIIEDNPELVGLNVTIPFKQDVIPFLSKLSSAAESIGAVNNISIKRETSKISLEGENTDWIGFSHSLQNMIGEARPKALILGTGGSSKAVEYVLKSLGIRYKLVSRKCKSKNCIDYQSLTPEGVSDSKLIINTTPLGMFPLTDNMPDIHYKSLTDQHFLFDLIYNPDQTRFLKQGVQQGCKVMNGLEMLQLQAEASWEIWNISHY